MKTRNVALLAMFKKDMDGNIAKADRNWPGLAQKKKKKKKKKKK